MKPSNLLLVTLVAGSIALAETPTQTAYSGLGDPHLNLVLRTDAEAERIAAVTALAADFSVAQRFEERPAGGATVRVLPDANAFSQPSGNITFEDELEFRLGNGLFRKLWVSSPSSTLASDGLGPLFNARSCQRCHIKDGRGHPPESTEDNSVSMFLRVSIMVPDGVPDDARVAEIANYIATLPDPTYGEQLQNFAVQGHASEYSLGITYKEDIVTLDDGTDVSLRHPTYTADNLGYGPLAEGAMLSPRVAPQMIGLGLLEAIPAADILANADPDDMDDDGISGRPNIVWSVEFDQPMLGRFGLKAGSPTVMQQSVRASQIIDHMRIFGRSDDGRRDEFDLSASLTNACHLMFKQLELEGIKLTTDLPDQGPPISGQQVMFEQVILNLLSNAKDAILANDNNDIQAGVDVSLVVGGHSADGCAIVRVQDNGGGFPAPVLDRLFDPFFTTKEPGKGTGLGLSISYGIVRDMGGTISARNLDAGACFEIVMPIGQAIAAE